MKFHAQRRRFRAVSIIFVSFAFTEPAEARTILERVLAAFDASKISRLNFLLLNVAETSGAPNWTERALSAGDAVIVGYDSTGRPQFSIAGPAGLSVTTEITDRGGAGVPPGFYPVGSPLFELPGGAQLSLYNTDAQGGALPIAYVDSGRIDGSINTFIFAELPQLTSELRAIASSMDTVFDIQDISATALGAVNSGQIVTSVEVAYVEGLQFADSNLKKALLATGSNLLWDHAQTGETQSFFVASSALGGASDSAILAANIATNLVSINASINTTIEGIPSRVGNIVTTALGAVNGGETIVSSR